jgi:hypothetical protein
MISRFMVAALCVVGPLTCVAHAGNINGEATYVSFSVPGSLGTYPMSINASMEVTGYYYVTPTVERGFLREADGTIDAIRRNGHGCTITAVELNCNMAHRLRTVDSVDDTRQADFLECNGDLGTFDRIVMNPPFADADIKHLFLRRVLKPVALGECPQGRPYGLPTPAEWGTVAERLRPRRPERRSSSFRAVHRVKGCARQAGAACAAPLLGFVP